MKYTVLGAVVVALAGGSYFLMQEHDAPPPAVTPYPSDQETLAKGKEIAEIMCGLCHATGSEDKSPLAAAPAFRNLSERYPVEYLEESLAEGMVAGHDDMPEIEFEPDEIEAFLGYLTSIQVKKPS